MHEERTTETLLWNSLVQPKCGHEWQTAKKTDPPNALLGHWAASILDTSTGNLKVSSNNISQKQLEITCSVGTGTISRQLHVWTRIMRTIRMLRAICKQRVATLRWGWNLNAFKSPSRWVFTVIATSEMKNSLNSGWTFSISGAVRSTVFRGVMANLIWLLSVRCQQPLTVKFVKLYMRFLAHDTVMGFKILKVKFWCYGIQESNIYINVFIPLLKSMFIIFNVFTASICKNSWNVSFLMNSARLSK